MLTGNSTAATALFTSDAIPEGYSTRTRIEGALAIGRYLKRALPIPPYGPGTIRHVLGSMTGGGYEWFGGPGAAASHGIVALALDNDEGFTDRGAATATCLAYRAPTLDVKVLGCVLRQPYLIFDRYEVAAKKEWIPRLKSMEENADVHLLNALMCTEINWMIDFPLEEHQNPYNFPIFGNKKQLAQMPRTHIIKAPLDPVADEV
ncbi:hypothetical protein IFR05_006998 [Cadophora sp. M221]|nr:hypothetical protein IFR05_006998 [Cadophora sp. M221]